MPCVQYHTITTDQAGQRIDNFLLAFFHYQLPKSLIYRWLRKGQLRVNKKRCKQPTYRIQTGDIIRIPPVETNAEKPPLSLPEDHANFLEQQILWETPDYLIINKPSGIAVHGGTGTQAGLIERLAQIRPHAKRLDLAHRLDKLTSGCLLITKKYQALNAFHALWRDRCVTKTYHALVHGNWPSTIKSIDLPLQRQLRANGERFVQVDQNGKSALTRLECLQHFNGYSLLALWPETGRTHQLRVHLANYHHPIVGDPKYGHPVKDQRIEKQLSYCQLALHAYQLSFTDPLNGQQVCVSAPYESTFQNVINRLTEIAQPAK